MARRREPAISSSFGISPLPTSVKHCSALVSVLSVLPHFRLPLMGGSHGFRSTTRRLFRSRFPRLRLFLNLASYRQLRRFILQKEHAHPLTGSSIVGTRFRFYFTPLPGCFSPFPSRYWFTSVTREYLEMVSRFQELEIFHVLPYSGLLLGHKDYFKYRGCALFG